MKTIVLLVLHWASISSLTGQELPNYFKDRNNNKLLLRVFLSVDCPISQNYIAELNRISSKYKSEITVEGVFPGKIKKRDLSTFISEYQVQFHAIRDANYKLVKELKATITPEVFLFNKSGILKYQGAIDNWYYELGKHRQQLTEQYLIDAIEAILLGNEPSKALTNAVGCPIQIH